MAAVAVKEGEQFDGSEIYKHVVSHLPSYARPRFIRIQVILLYTAIFCSQKNHVLRVCLYFFFLFFSPFFRVECHGADRYFQANEAEVSGAGFRSGACPGPSLRPRRS